MTDDRHTDMVGGTYGTTERRTRTGYKTIAFIGIVWTIRRWIR